ncbi:hypothetical protein BD408DRAFT_426885 [Parasitella parasitica]|nr:hypothetical protein BD408DRAFT_426885 [Parasitella parasitica]
MVYCLMTCLGEMATYMPVSGSFNHYATRFVDPAFGFALGWNYWLSVREKLDFETFYTNMLELVYHLLFNDQ